MSFRSRTDLFNQYRRSYHNTISRPAATQETGLTGKDYSAIPIMDLADDRWLAWMSSLGRLQRYIHEIEEKVKDLEEPLEAEKWPKIDFRVGAPSVPGSPIRFSDSNGSHSKFFVASERIKNMFSTAQKEVYLLTSGRKEAWEGTQCRQLKQNAQISMNARLGEVATKFQAFQTAYVIQVERNAEFVSKRISTAPTSSSSPITLVSTKPAFLDGDSEHVDGHDQQQLLPLAQSNIEARIAAERSQAIDKIAQSVLDLKTILEHMHTLTIQQGSMLDRIDTHIDEANWYTARGVTLVEERVAVQKDYLVRKAVLLGLVVLILVTFIHLLSR